MLIYDPALDPYHSAVRILTIATSATQKQIKLSIDKVRIADYFLVYPYQMINFRFPKQFRSMRVAVKALENPYRHASGNHSAFERMRPIFFSSLSGLVAADLIDGTELKHGTVKLYTDMPTDLAEAVSKFKERQSLVGKFVLSDLIGMHTNGDEGLKHRSGLIEHRYDVT